MLLAQNFSPPVFPVANSWNRTVPAHIPPRLDANLRKHFEFSGSHLEIGEMQIEETAALGFGVSALLLVSVLAGIRNRIRPAFPVSRLQGLILLSPWFSLLVVMSQFGLSGIGRIIAPYYLLLIPVFLVCPAQEQVVRARWWRCCAGIAYCFALMLLVISPARPLWPANFVMKKLGAENSSNPKLRRIGEVYATYSERADAFAPVTAKLPPGLSLLGIISSDDPETSLWRPFGSRRILHVKAEDSLGDLEERGIEYVLVNSTVLTMPTTEWTEQMRGQIVWKMTLRLKTSLPPKDWYLVRLNPAPSPAQPVASTSSFIRDK
jgi:hypothetical protein